MERRLASPPRGSDGRGPVEPAGGGRPIALVGALIAGVTIPFAPPRVPILAATLAVLSIGPPGGPEVSTTLVVLAVAATAAVRAIS